jgi:large repetitive protein
VRITRTGYQDLLLGTRQLATTGVNSFTLEPKPIAATGLTISTTPASSGISWGSVVFNVTPAGGGTFVSATATQTGVGTARLNWFDTRVPANTARPGTYTVTASAPGYVSTPKVVTCAVGASSCTWATTGPVTGPIVLVKEGALTISAVDGANAPINGAQFTLRRNGLNPQTVTAPAGANAVTFTGLAPNATDYTVEIHAAGYAFGTAGGGAADALVSTCGSTITIQPGVTLGCAATLTKLNTVQGDVDGIIAVEGGTGPVRDLADAHVTITRCARVVKVAGTAYCTTTSTDPADTFSTIVDGSGNFSLTGTIAKEGLADGDWLLTATAPGFQMPSVPPPPAGDPDGPLEKGVLIEDLAGDATVPIDLYIDLANVTITVRDHAGEVNGAQVRLVSTAGTLSPTSTTTQGGYVFAGVVPGSYEVTVSKAGYFPAGQSIPVHEGVPVQSLALTLVRGASSAVGIVDGGADDGVAGGVNGVQVRICATSDCADGPAESTDRTPLEQTTRENPLSPGQNGWYQFRNVPNGSFYLVFSKHGYETTYRGPYTFDYLASALGPISPVLVVVKRNAEIALTSTWESDSLAGITIKLSAPGQAAFSATTDTDGHALVNQLPRGCWAVAVTDPRSGHHAAFADLESTGPVDTDDPACADGELLVSGAEDEPDPAAGSIAVDEGAVGITVANDAIAGYGTADNPTEATVTITRDGATDPAVTLTGVDVGASAATTAWLPAGTYTVAATPEDGATAFWDPDSVSVTIPATPTPATLDFVPAALTFVEHAATLTVTVNGVGPSGATLTLTPPAGESVPAAYLPDVKTGTHGNPAGTFEFTLPGGSWTVTATITGSSDSDSADLTEPGDHDLTLTVVEPPPPTTTPTATPTP